MIEMQYINSSNVEQIGYDEDLSELHVKFLSGPTIYVYLGIPLQLFEDLMNAPSKGGFLHANVYENYPVEKR